MIAFTCAFAGLLFVGLHLKRRYNFLQRQRRGDTDFGDYVRYHSGKYGLLVSSAFLLGVAFSWEDLNAKSISDSALTVIFFFVLCDVFISRAKSKK